MNKEFKKLEAEHAKETKRIHDDSEARFTADMERWTAERNKKAGSEPPAS